ncbi:MAG: HAD-IA family hydrolase [Anaerolineae bacterium]|nr:HAD-IA family hydrolase [Anaerolineae bacterium]
MIHAVLFDLDGLMADSEPLAEQAWNRVLARYGHRLDPQTLRDILGLRVIDSAQFLCQRFRLPLTPEQAMAEREQFFLQAVPTQLRAMPGLYPLLAALDEREIPLAVATSAYRRYALLALETLGVADAFRVVVTGDEVARGKPHPDIFLLAAERLSVLPARCLVLEDAPRGIAAAEAAGMVSAAVPHPRVPRADFAAAHWLFASLEAVREELAALLQTERYDAAGGVVVHDGRILVLLRASRSEVRLPKGHVDPGESAQQAALRETQEEGGYGHLAVTGDLGTQTVVFEHDGRRIVRAERYFRMALTAPPEAAFAGAEPQFQPVWLAPDEALARLTFAAEQEWVRRAVGQNPFL